MAQASKIEQQKILRVFKMMNIVRITSGKTVHRLAELLETDELTIYRYCKLLEAWGFEVIKEFSKYKIKQKPGMDQTLNYGTFSAEESNWLRSMIESQGKQNLLHDSILKKLSVRSKVKKVTEELFKANLGILVDEIGKGIQEKVKVWLKDYYSLSSDTTSDRLVEPVAFSSNYEAIHAYELESKSMKVFKIERIGEVILSQKNWASESKHVIPGRQLFGFTGKNKFLVKLKLSKKAYQLMMEEHPNARPFMFIKNRNQYFFNGEIPQRPGLARFILGLPGEVTVEEGEELKDYLNEQLGRSNF